ncbi:alpha-1,6-mannosyltransferase [Xylographa soralifera]|nr:alpha-1,6-mannosyltransferase [Xylographa soralifera]
MKDALGDNDIADPETSVKLSAAPAQDLICFGMLVDIQCKILTAQDGQEMPIALEVEGNSNIILYSSSKSVFGYLEPTAHKIVATLRTKLQIQLFAHFHNGVSRDNQTTNIRAGSTKFKRSIVLHVILYGPSMCFAEVGQFTTTCNLFLQHPWHCNRNVPYRNPQCLTPESSESIYTGSIERLFDNEPIAASGVFQNPIDLFADTAEQEALECAISPKALRTKLYKHQKQALSFMLHRERGWALSGTAKDIWKEQYQSSGKVIYVNTVSGQKQTRPPPNFCGGLLIDAPGLGKSLSVISLVLYAKESRALTKSTAVQRITTLLIVPKTLIQTWEYELHRHLTSPDVLRSCVYYGKDRWKYLQNLERYDLVITTYSVVRSDWQINSLEPKEVPTLHSIKWGRIVLDEAHIIREPSKSFAKSVCALSADRRWGVTGTPIQNRLLDLFSLFKFLQCSPFDDLKVFNSHVTQNWRASSDQVSVAKLKTLVNCISLRRPKSTVELLDRRDDMVYIDFNNEEKQHYQRVRSSTLSNLHTAGEEGSSANFINALKWLNELRLICNHGLTNTRATQFLNDTGSRKTSWDNLEAQLLFDQLDQAGLAKCSNPDCSQDLTSALSSGTDTKHMEEPRLEESLELLCSSCFQSRVGKSNKSFKVCNYLPRCKSQETVQEAVAHEPRGLYYGEIIPSKIGRLVKDLCEAPEAIKSVVFSCWTRTFDIIQPQLNAKSIRCVRLDGSLSMDRRAGVVREFRDNPGIKVLLATITCGGVGLDLTAASRAYIMEPQWNPMSELQALDRIHRLGQKEKVVTIRYIVRETYEEQVLKLQRRKQELADLTLGGGAISKADLTYGRLQYLKDLVR